MSVTDAVIDKIIAEAERKKKPLLGSLSLGERGRAPGTPGPLDFRQLDLKAWLAAHGVELTPDEWENDKYFFRCIWEEEHSTTEDSATDTFARDGTGKLPPMLHCSHAHSGCGDPRHGRHNLETLAREWGDAEQFGATKRANEGFPLTDLGNAERMCERHRGRVLYCHDRQCWLIWTETHWAEDREAKIVGLAKDTTRALLAELNTIEDETKRKLMFAHVMKSESERGIRGMLKLAQAQVPILSEALDRDPWQLNFTNGTLDLRNGNLYPHVPDQMITKLVPFAYDAAARCPHWEAFIANVTRHEALARYLQKAVGYSLTGSTREKCLFMLEGPTDSGKTTFLETVGNVLREAGYGTQVPAEMLLAKREGGIPSDVAKCAGRRFVWTSETDDNRRLATGLIKAITGRDRVSARFMHHDWFDFTSTFKLWFATNHRPTIREQGDAIWNRIRYLPFRFTIKRDEQDRDLGEKLKAELPGILAWMVRGCALWEAEGLETPEVMVEALSAYRHEMDMITQWIEERCVRAEGVQTACLPLYRSYGEWCKAGNEVPLSLNRFSPEMEKRFKRINKRVVLFEGLRLMTALEAQGIGLKE